MWKTPIVYVDIETNGGNGPNGRIIEVAAIKVSDDKIIDTFTSLVNPGASIPFWITNLTGIENNDLVGAPYFEDIANQLHNFLGGCLFAAHNVLFDYSFIKRQFAELGYTFSPKLFCTVRLSRALYKVQGHSLEKIIQRHKIKVSNRHRAYDDALAMYKFVQIAAKEHGQLAVRENIELQTKTKTLPPNVDKSVIDALPETAGVYIFEDDKNMPLYVGKSVNIRARVKSHFTNATKIAKELKMSLQSHNISYIQTATEIEALLLESAKIKELQPIYNRLLRRKKIQHILARTEDMNGYESFAIARRDLSENTKLDDVYGVFTTRNKAKSKLDEIMRTFQLCPRLLGIEKGSGACFRFELGLCKGACAGIESAAAYNQRVEFALERTKIETWPYKGKVAISISKTRKIIVDQWVPESIYDSEENSSVEIDQKFDIDVYKIIRSYVRNADPPIQLLPR